MVWYVAIAEFFKNIEISRFDWFLILLIIGGLIYILLVRKWFLKGMDEERRGKGGEDQPNRIRGWMITFIDTIGDFPNVPYHKNLQIIYGEANVYPNGKIESIPSTFDLIYYENEAPRKLNPFISQSAELIDEYGKRNEHGEIIWADGTDRYQNIFDTALPILSQQQSSGLTKKNVEDTTNALKQRRAKK